MPDKHLRFSRREICTDLFFSGVADAFQSPRSPDPKSGEGTDFLNMFPIIRGAVSRDSVKVSRLASKSALESHG